MSTQESTNNPNIGLKHGHIDIHVEVGIINY